MLIIRLIFKSNDTNYVMRVRIVAVIFFAVGITFASIHGGRGAPLPHLKNYRLPQRFL
jgi:hypothetical protein